MIRHWLAMLSVVAWASGAWAETPAEWPSRAVRAIVPVAAGSGIDIVAQQLAKQLGRPFVVENRPGGATTAGNVHQRRSRRPCAAPSFGSRRRTSRGAGAKWQLRRRTAMG